MSKLVGINLSLAIASCALAALPAIANVFSADGTDPRVPQTRIGEGRIYAPIGGIEMDKPRPSAIKDETMHLPSKYERGTSTAVLISPCYIATNYHSVFGGSLTPSSNDTSSFYSVGERDGIYVKTSARPVIWGRHITGDGGDKIRKEQGEDWAILKLHTCRGSELGWMEIAELNHDDLVNRKVTNAAHPEDKDPKQLWRHTDCRIREVQVPEEGFKNSFLHSCASRRGSSGSPLFDMDLGYPRLLALNLGELNTTPGVLPRYDRTRANVAVDIRAVLPRIRKLIADDIRASGLRSNPSHRK